MMRSHRRYLGVSIAAAVVTLIPLIGSPGWTNSAAVVNAYSSDASGARTTPPVPSPTQTSSPPADVGPSPSGIPRTTFPTLPEGKPHAMRPPTRMGTSPSTGPGPLYTTSPSYMSYHSFAPVLTNPQIFVVFWGSWWTGTGTDGTDTAAHAMAYVTDFIRGVGGTSWFNELTQYCQGISAGSTDCHLANPADMIHNPTSVLGGLWPDSTNPIPAVVDDNAFRGEALNAWTHFGVRATNQLIVVFLAYGATVNPPATGDCAWHKSANQGGNWTAYAAMPYQPGPGGCYTTAVNGGGTQPIGQGHFDGLSIVGGHEITEAVTDPVPDITGAPTAWGDSTGAQGEIGDKCDLSVPSGHAIADKTYHTPYGNIDIAGNYMAVQGLWSNVDFGCVLSGKYVAEVPQRLLDTRYSSPIQSGQLITVGVHGQAGVPSSGVGAVVLNVTVVNPATAGDLIVYGSYLPTGQPPFASAINYSAHETLANLVEVTLTNYSNLAIYNQGAGSTDVILDVEGWVLMPATTLVGPAPGSLYCPQTPARFLDTRTGTKFGPGERRTLQVSGFGYTAAILNVTIVNPSTSSWLIVWPDGTSMPSTSNLNFVAGQTVANRVMTGVSSSGLIDVYNGAGTVDVIVDEFGLFGQCFGSAGTRYVGLTPTRVLDTRSLSPIGSNQTYQFQFNSGSCMGNCAYQGAIPNLLPYTLPSAMQEPLEDVVANATVTQPGAAGALLLWQMGYSQPSASDLNFTAGLTIANMVVPQVGTNVNPQPPYGNVDILNASGGSTQLILDVGGYYI